MAEGFKFELDLVSTESLATWVAKMISSGAKAFRVETTLVSFGAPGPVSTNALPCATVELTPERELASTETPGKRDAKDRARMSRFAMPLLVRRRWPGVPGLRIAPARSPAEVAPRVALAHVSTDSWATLAATMAWRPRLFDATLLTARPGWPGALGEHARRLATEDRWNEPESATTTRPKQAAPETEHRQSRATTICAVCNGNCFSKK